MTQFAPGDRVVVVADNVYDENGPSEHFGVMAGHYGRVVEVRNRTRSVTFKPNTAFVTVDVMGHISGNVSKGIQMMGGENWLFFDFELEHVD